MQRLAASFLRPAFASLPRFGIFLCRLSFMFYFNYDNLQRHQSSKGPLHSIPPHLVVQCGSAYAQHGECSPFSLNPPARLLQRPLDIPFFEIRQRRVSGKQLFGHLPTSQSLDASGSLCMLHRIRKRQVPPPGQDDRLLDDVAQLAYIPRPTPAFQNTAVFRRKILNAFPMMLI